MKIVWQAFSSTWGSVTLLFYKILKTFVSKIARETLQLEFVLCSSKEMKLQWPKNDADRSTFL